MSVCLAGANDGLLCEINMFWHVPRIDSKYDA